MGTDSRHQASNAGSEYVTDKRISRSLKVCCLTYEVSCSEMLWKVDGYAM